MASPTHALNTLGGEVKTYGVADAATGAEADTLDGLELVCCRPNGEVGKDVVEKPAPGRRDCNDSIWA